jgi:hypothetical protein
MATETIIAAWAWDKFGKELLENLGDVSKKWIEVFNWKGASKAYHDKVRELYGEIRVFGNPRPTPLGDIFTDVYILDKPTAYRRFDLTEICSDPEVLKRDERRVEGVDLVKQPEHERLYILGRPGAGKTTFLKYLALQAVEEKIDRVPIFVDLKAWADSGLELMDFIAKQFEICNFPEALPFIEHILKKGRALVLFDGLDEVPQEANRRTRIIQALTNFSNQYNTSQCVITCRIAATDYSFTRFVYVEIAPFTDPQIESYVCKWFADAEQKRDLFLQEMQKEEHRGLRDLARTPLLLSILCLAFDQTMHFPQRRVEVYEEAIEALLKKWDASRSIHRDEVYEKLTLGRKRQMFARLAVESFHRGDFFLDQGNLEKFLADYLRRLPPADRAGEVDAEVVLKAIEAQHGILVQRAHRVYSFAHLSFQEYFAAKYLADNGSGDRLRGMFRDHLTDARWREVLLMVASLLDEADTFFVCFQETLDALVAEDATLVELLQWAERKAAAVSPERHTPAAVRSVYCFFALDLALDLDLARARALDLDLARARARDLALALDLDLALALDLARALDLALALALDLDLARALDLDLDPELALDVMLFYLLLIAQAFEANWDNEEIRREAPAFARYLQKVTTFVRDTHTGELADALEQLEIPGEEIADDAWRSFINALQPLMQQHRDIGHEWQLSDKQVWRLGTYLEASKLLLDCLNLAVVSDRAAIENRLLLPPAAGGSG